MPRESACCSMTAMRCAYDTLVLATGARHAYFGHDEWEPFAPGLKTLEDATTLRRRILVAFERAERETDPARRAALLTFVIIGAGPTGVEMAGTIADLAKDTLPPDFRNIDTHKTRVVLIEAGPRVLRRLSRGSLRLCAALAGGDRRRGGAGAARHRMCHRWRRLWRQQAGGQNHRLGRRRARLARGGMAERARRPRLPFEGRARSYRARPSRHLCRWRYRDDRRPRRQSRAGHRAGRQAAGTLRGGADQGAPRAAARCRRSATSTPAASRRSARKRR